MGMQGPLTAQALGRSPYDDVVEGEGPDDDEPTAQQYDYRGRPINPESKRIYRDLIRAHNEVMLVVGVAEPENPQPEPEAETKRLHNVYEEGIGSRLIWTTKRCIEAVGIFGVTGFRQRVLVYRRFSRIPFWDLYQISRSDYSISRDLLPGAPAGIIAAYIDRRCYPPWLFSGEDTLARRLTLEAWSYLRVHFELYAAFQRLGLISSTRFLPPWKYFVPFTNDSPIPPPPPLNDLSPNSLLSWLSGVIIATGPFVLWALVQRVLRKWKPHTWQRVIALLPSPIFSGRSIEPPPPPPAPAPTPEDRYQESAESAIIIDTEDPGEDLSPSSSDEADPLPESSTSHTRQPSVYSTGGGADDYDTDDGEHEVVSATLISFDVEASESTDVPQGLWSAELRPSVGPESRAGAPPSVYLSTMLTKLPSLMAAKVLNDAVLRILITPYEAVSLRLAALTFNTRRGLPIAHMLRAHPISGFSLTWVVNFFGAELLHLALSGEVWAIFAVISQYFHMSEEEWKDYRGTNWGERLGTFHSGEPLF